ncbi:hypothetical protein BGZ72_004885 [Mortierella alpina]|nr:hypothetical protein BGZ72_004885 [Mortierella alpina]
MLRVLKAQTQALRGIPALSSSVSKANKPKAVKPSEVKKPLEADKLHTMLKSDFTFHGSIIGGRQLKVVSRLKLRETLAILKCGLPAEQLGWDHFAPSAKFRIADWVAGWLGWGGQGNLDNNSLPDDDDNEEMVEVDVRGKKCYFS